MSVKMMVFAPHPDDEMIGCAGLMRHVMAAQGTVLVAYLTSGEHGVPEEDGARREGEATRSLAALLQNGAGVVEPRGVFLRFPDGGIRPEERDQFTRVLSLLRGERPDVVLLPHRDDGSFDHAQAHRLVWRALEMAGSRNFAQGGDAHWVGTVLAYEVWTPMAAPGYLIDLDATDVRAKTDALACYSSQVKGADQPEYAGPGGLSLTRLRGAMSTGGHREAFAVMRAARVLW